MQELIDPFERLLKDCFAPEAVRALDSGAPVASTWQSVEDSGFLDLMVPESAGGAGVTPLDAAPLLQLVGAYAVPLPVGETMLARALLARAGKSFPQGPIALRTAAPRGQPCRFADHILDGSPDDPILSAIEGAAVTPAPGDWGGASSDRKNRSLIAVSAALRAALIAGAAGRILAMCVDYANGRVQFGKPIGRQQAVQQQIAVLAEQAVAARFAANIGMRSIFDKSVRDSAVAKYGASIAATRVSAIAHGVHGAIGISEEHDLQLFTRALARWRLSDGAESYWAGKLGSIWALNGAQPSRFVVNSSR